MWPSLFAVSMGMMAFLPTLPFYLQERFGLDDPAEVRTWAGLIFGAAPLSAALFGPIWGVVADRYGRKPMALRALFGIAAVTAVMPLATSPAFLFALRILQGILAGYVAPALALVAVDVPAERQGRVLGNLQVAMALGLLAGPALGAEISLHLVRNAVFVAASVLAALAFATVLAFAREGQNRAPRGDGGTLRALQEQARMLLRSRVVVLLLGAILVLRFGQNMVEAFVALWIEELGPPAWLHDRSASLAHALDRATALAFSILAIGQIVFVPLWGRLADRFGPLRCLALMALLLAVVTALTGVVRDIDGYLVLRSVAAAFLAGSMTLSYAAVGRRVPPSRKSFAFACVQSCIQLGLCSGPVAGGILSRATGLDGLFFVAAGCLAAVGIAMLWLWRMPFPAVADDE